MGDGGAIKRWVITAGGAGGLVAAMVTWHAGWLDEGERRELRELELETEEDKVLGIAALNKYWVNKRKKMNKHILTSMLTKYSLEKNMESTCLEELLIRKGKNVCKHNPSSPKYKSFQKF